MNIRYSMILSAMALIANNTLYCPNAYVTNSENNTVSIFDTTTNAVTGIVTDLMPATFNNPQQVAVTPDGKTAYVVNAGDGGFTSFGSVSVIDVATGAVTQVVNDPLVTFNSPYGIAITPDGTKALVTNQNGNSVSVIDLATNTVTQNIMDPSFNMPSGIAITPGGTQAYVANHGAASPVSVIAIASSTVTTITDPSFNGMQNIAITFDGTKVYITNKVGSSVSVITIPGNTVTTVNDPGFTLSAPYDIAISPDDTKAYVTNNSIVVVVDVASNSVDTTTPTILNPNFIRASGVVFTQDGTTAYVANNAAVGLHSNTVSIITVATNTVASPGDVTDQIPRTFEGPFFIAIVPTAPTPANAIIISGAQKRNKFLTQTDYINIITWTTPTNVTPVSYTLYRDAALTMVAGTVAAPAPLLFLDHNRNPALTYTYYLVAVDQAGNKTLLGSVTVRGLNQV